MWLGARLEPIMNSYAVAIVHCGSRSHLDDLRILQERHLAVPHDYSTWAFHCTTGSWLWCRIVGADGRLITGFAIQLTASRALPGTRIGKVDRLGRNLHEEMAGAMGTVLREVARKIPRLLRLDARIFDEDPVRRQKLSDSLRAAGWRPSQRRRQYSHTLVLSLAESESQVFKRFSKRVRSTIRKALDSPALRFGPIGKPYADRIRYLHAMTFERTGGVPPPVDVEGILDDSSGDNSSLLIGAFAREREIPEDLVAVAWARLHGDYAVLELNASERSRLFSNRLSPGFGLMARLIEWAIQHGAQWIDLGGLPSKQPTADDPMHGIVEFKMRFSSDVREVAEEWDFEPSPLLATAESTVRSVRNSARIFPRSTNPSPPVIFDRLLPRLGTGPLLIAGAGIVLTAVFGEMPSQDKYAAVLQDSFHAPAFAVLSLITLTIIRRQERTAAAQTRKATRTVLVQAMAIVVAMLLLGAATEGLQGLLGRDAEVDDIISAVIGAIGATSLWLYAGFRASSRIGARIGRISALLVCGGMVGYWLSPLLK